MRNLLATISQLVFSQLSYSEACFPAPLYIWKGSVLTNGSIWGAYLLPMVKATLYGNALVILVPVAVWIGSIYVDEPNRMALIWIAIFLGKSKVLWRVVECHDRY